MRRVGIMAAVTVFGAMVAGEARAQILGPTLIGPTVGPSYGFGGGGFGGSSMQLSQAARRALRRQALHAAAHRHDSHRDHDRRWHDHHHGPSFPPVVFLPPPTRASIEPFGGSPQGGNYFYWLSREYAKGRVSKSEYDRKVYGVGRK